VKESLKKKWVKALRSGEYEQGSSLLCQEKPGDPEEFQFCCLGVLADIAVDGDWVKLFGDWHLVPDGCSESDARSGSFDDGLLAKLGLSEEDQSKLIRMNDGDDLSDPPVPRKSFAEIASYIEGRKTL
jgi:hypothetical protein